MINKIKEIAETLNWNVVEFKNGEIEFRRYSPAGEDFGFTVNAENAVEEICNYCFNFDIDEHIEMWIEAKRNGIGCVPSVRTLVTDAEAICNMLHELALAIGGVC